MIIKKVNRYYCEFCKRANCSKPSIQKHEASCTLNPERICRMCAVHDHKQKGITELTAILPEPNLSKGKFGDVSLTNVKEIEAVMGELRELAQGCPACIMAALRQKRIPVPEIRSYNFQTECREWWPEEG